MAKKRADFAQKSAFPLTLGKEVYAWDAPDYYPYERGMVWFVGFCGLVFGSAGAALYFWQDVVTAVAVLVAAAVYFFVHRHEGERCEIALCEKGLWVDGKVFPWKEVDGYWFLYDETVQVLNFEYQKGKRHQRFILQLGEQKPEKVQKVLEQLGVKELKDQRESLLDLWIRALKL